MLIIIKFILYIAYIIFKSLLLNYFCKILIILAILNKNSILPNTIYYILVIIIAAIGAYFFWLRFGSIITRDNNG